MGAKWTVALAGLIWLAGNPDEARATSLEITPVMVHVAPGAQATTIEVANRGGVAAAIHLRAFAWSQIGDKDVLTPTQDIIMSPPIFTLPKNGSQTIRLMLRRGAPKAGERTFRLLIDEVPPTKSTTQQILVAMRISLPVIIASAAPRTRALQWHAQRQAGGRVTLTATNHGNAYDRVQAIAVTTTDGAQRDVAVSGTNAYILAGAQRQWVVKSAGAASTLRLRVTTRAGQSEQLLAIAQ